MKSSTSPRQEGLRAAVLAASVALSVHPSSALVTVPTPGTIRWGRAAQLQRLPVASLLTTISKKPAQKKMNSQLYYADEWLDASVELAFHNGRADSPSPPREAPTLLKRLLLRFSRTWYQIRETIRTKIERSTVYVLECSQGKYYVGSTTNRKRRVREHRRGKGSKWTRTYKPLRVVEERRRIPSKYLLGTESTVTAEYMLKMGVNNVRGSMFCSPREFHMGDIDALTKFLGHYCNLNYRKVNARLSQTLPPSPRKLRKKNAYYAHSRRRCFSCGKEGHLAASCPEKSAIALKP
ncbi:hypothetical protein ACHAXT_009689 [Thalassiosira profunda]